MKVLVYLATKTPTGKNRRKPRVTRIPWAMMSLSVDVSGMSEDPLEGVVDGELESIVFVKSSVFVPESRCCTMVASGSEELGAVVANAQIIFCCVSEFAYEENQPKHCLRQCKSCAYGNSKSKFRLCAACLFEREFNPCI